MERPVRPWAAATLGSGTPGGGRGSSFTPQPHPTLPSPSLGCKPVSSVVSQPLLLRPTSWQLQRAQGHGIRESWPLHDQAREPEVSHVRLRQRLRLFCHSGCVFWGEAYVGLWWRLLESTGGPE